MHIVLFMQGQFCLLRYIHKRKKFQQNGNNTIPIPQPQPEIPQYRRESYRPSVTCITTKPPLSNDKGDQLLYGLDDVPPWYMCLFLGFQVALINFHEKNMHVNLHFKLINHISTTSKWSVQRWRVHSSSLRPYAWKMTTRTRLISSQPWCSCLASSPSSRAPLGHVCRSCREAPSHILSLPWQSWTCRSGNAPEARSWPVWPWMRKRNSGKFGWERFKAPSFSQPCSKPCLQRRVGVVKGEIFITS